MAELPRVADGRDPAAVVEALRAHGGVIVERFVDGRVRAAINVEVDAAVAAAEPGMRTVNAAVQAFYGPCTKHVSALASVGHAIKIAMA